MPEWVLLGDADRAGVEQLLAPDAVEAYLFLDDLRIATALGQPVETLGLYGFRDGERWLALACGAGGVKVHVLDTGALSAVAERVREWLLATPRLTGRRETVEALVAMLALPIDGEHTPEPYHCLVLEKPAPALRGYLETRPAAASELMAIATLEATMKKDDGGPDPFTTDPAGHLMRVGSRIAEREYYVLEENGEILYQVAIGCHAPLAGGEIVNSMTPVELRGRGHAKRGLGGACRLALERYPRLFARVRVGNEPALRLMLGLGWQQRPWQFLDVSWG